MEFCFYLQNHRNIAPKGPLLHHIIYLSWHAQNLHLHSHCIRTKCKLNHELKCPTTIRMPIYLFRRHTSGLQISFAGHTAASMPLYSRGFHQRLTSSQSYMIRIPRYQIHCYCLIIQNYTFLEKRMLPIECLGQNYGVSDASTWGRSFVGLVLVWTIPKSLWSNSSQIHLKWSTHLWIYG